MLVALSRVKPFGHTNAAPLAAGGDGGLHLLTHWCKAGLQSVWPDALQNGYQLRCLTCIGKCR